MYQGKTFLIPQTCQRNICVYKMQSISKSLPNEVAILDNLAKQEIIVSNGLANLETWHPRTTHAHLSARVSAAYLLLRAAGCGSRVGEESSSSPQRHDPWTAPSPLGRLVLFSTRGPGPTTSSPARPRPDGVVSHAISAQRRTSGVVQHARSWLDSFVSLATPGRPPHT